MGKRDVSSSSSDREDGKRNIEQNPKRNINQLLLQTANLTSKNQLLKRGLQNSDLHSTLNKKISIPNKNITKHRDEKTESHNSKFKQDSFQDTNYSSSSTSDSEDKNATKWVITENKINVTDRKRKKKNISSNKSSADETGSKIRIKKDSEDSESDSSDSEEKSLSQNGVKSVSLQKIKKNNSSSSESEVESESDNENKNTIQIKKETANRFYIKKEIKTSSSSSEPDMESEKNVGQLNPNQSYKRKLPKQCYLSSDDEGRSKINLSLGKIKKKSPSKIYEETGSSMKLGENAQNDLDKESSDEDEQTMETNGKTVKDKCFSNSDSDTSNKSKVKVLQNIRLTPRIKDSKEKLAVIYPGIKQITTNMKLNFSESEDIYLFRIPKNVDPHLLENTEIDLDEECKINIGEKYSIKPTTKIPDPTLVISDNCKVIHFKRNIKMEKYRKSKKEPNIVIPEKMSMAFPDKLNKRHPLFGSDFEQKITLSKDVEKKLDDAIADLLRKEKKAKKKKDKERKLKEEEEKQKQDIFNLLNSHSSVKKIKKDTSEDSAFSSSGSIDKISRKHKKDKKVIIDEILKNVKTENDSDSLLNMSREKKKKEKKMKRGWEEMPLESIKKEIRIENIKKEEDSPALSKQEKKRMSIINSTLKSDVLKTPSFSPDVSGIGSDTSSLEKKSKKCKRKRELLEDRTVTEKKMISDILDSLKSNILTPEKIKKKKKHKELDI